jgi:hypothetical protein
MSQAILNSLTEDEWLLVDATSADKLSGLDEDELLELHTRVRRARTKYVKLYRRSASVGVQQHGGRGVAYPKNQRNRDRAEVFEGALAQVSKQLGVVARKAAAELRAERLAEARANRGSGPAAAGGASTQVAAPVESTRRRATKTTGGLKKDASSRAKGARRQAAKDSR